MQQITPIMREKYFKILDGEMQLIGVTYELNKYLHRLKIASYMIESKLTGKNLKECLVNMGVNDFDNADLVSKKVNELIQSICKKYNTLIG